MKITNTTPEDVRNLKPVHWYDDAWRVMFSAENAADHLDAYCRTFWHDDEIIGIGGVTPQMPGTGEVWMALTDEAYKHKVTLARTIVRMIALAQFILHAHRLQITVPAEAQLDHYKLFRERCGFHYEGTLHSYYEPGKDYWLYYRLFKPDELEAPTQ